MTAGIFSSGHWREHIFHNQHLVQWQVSFQVSCAAEESVIVRIYIQLLPNAVYYINPSVLTQLCVRRNTYKLLRSYTSTSYIVLEPDQYLD